MLRGMKMVFKCKHEFLIRLYMDASVKLIGLFNYNYYYMLCMCVKDDDSIDADLGIMHARKLWLLHLVTI